MNTVIECPKCQQPLPDELFNRSGMVNCPSCERPVRVLAFPALFAKVAQGSAGETLFSDDEAGCFYHPQKRAVVHCQNCGRFLCALCDIELNGQHLCTACLESGKKKGKLNTLENHRILYDSIALSLTTYPLLFVYLSLICAPIALFVAIRYWKAPSSIVRKGKIRFILAIVLAILELLGWAALFFAIFTYIPFDKKL